MHGRLPYFDQRAHQNLNHRRFGHPSAARIYDDAAGDFLFCMDTANSSSNFLSSQKQSTQGTIDTSIGDNVDISLTAPPFAQ